MGNIKTTNLMHQWLMKDDEFFKQIDDVLGGWPVGYKYVSFYHNGVTDRPCIFTNTELHTGWYTTIYSSDDYYWWKVSDARKEKYKREIKNEFVYKLIPSLL